MPKHLFTITLMMVYLRSDSEILQVNLIRADLVFSVPVAINLIV